MSDIVLYAYPVSTRSDRISWALQELGLSYQVKVLNPMAGDNRQPEFLKLNSHAKVPVLQIDGLALTESVAILDYLAEREGKLKPTDLVQQYQYMQALSYLMTELEAYTWIYFQATFLKAIYKWTDGVEQDVVRPLQKALPQVATWIKQRGFIASEQFTMADILGFHVIVGAMRILSKAEHLTFKQTAEKYEFADYLQTLLSRPSVSEQFQLKGFNVPE